MKHSPDSCLMALFASLLLILFLCLPSPSLAISEQAQTSVHPSPVLFSLLSYAGILSTEDDEETTDLHTLDLSNRGGSCNPNSTQDTDPCGRHGACTKVGEEYICICEERYAGDKCSHKRKSKLTAFLLSLLIGLTGADRYYLGFIWIGVLKMLLNLCGCLPSCLLQICAKRISASGEDQEPLLGHRMAGSDKTGFALCTVLLGTCLSCCVYLGAMAWWLADWILILRGELNDSSGFALYDDM